ncbi:hypothetical protein HDU97_008982 [Phlyctochytrium planicorne]|nr:hypothetical protein HDU97_008982 [Phlyctochytrium planicorne]
MRFSFTLLVASLFAASSVMAVAIPNDEGRALVARDLNEMNHLVARDLNEINNEDISIEEADALDGIVTDTSDVEDVEVEDVEEEELERRADTVIGDDGEPVEVRTQSEFRANLNAADQAKLDRVEGDPEQYGNGPEENEKRR